MVSPLIISGIVLQGLLVVAAVIFIAVYFYKKERFSWKPVWIGALTFFIFTQILEKFLHVIVLGANPDLRSHAVLFLIYGPLAAGLFEETGRYLSMRFILKPYNRRKDAIAYGLGHGGFEALFIGIIGSFQSLIYAILLNQGRLETLLSGKLPAESIAALKDSVLGLQFSHLLAGGMERIMALAVQIALSLFMLYGLRNGKRLIWPAAVLLHAAVDFVPALYQAHSIHLFIAEAIIAVMGIAAIVYIVKSRKAYAD